MFNSAKSILLIQNQFQSSKKRDKVSKTRKIKSIFLPKNKIKDFLTFIIEKIVI